MRVERVHLSADKDDEAVGGIAEVDQGLAWRVRLVLKAEEDVVEECLLHRVVRPVRGVCVCVCVCV